MASQQAFRVRDTEPSPLAQWSKQLLAMRPESDEFERFIQQSPSSLTEGMSAIDWWLEPGQKRDFPCLSKMAIDVLSVPAMSAEAERIFSGARRTISWERSRLGGSTVEATECIKSWNKNQQLLDVEFDLSESGEAVTTRDKTIESPPPTP